MSNTIVIKLGGSLLSQSEQNIFNTEYLQRLKLLLLDPQLKENKYFFVVGGGYIMRKYRDLLYDAGVKKDMDIHWVGTTVNVLHAYLVKAYMGDIVDDEVIKYEDYYDEGCYCKATVESCKHCKKKDKKFSIERLVKVGGGGRPGHSGDVDAVIVAQKLKAIAIISLKNIDGVYEADPKLYPEVKKISNLSWDRYLEIIGNKKEHKPGANYPIDPIASRMAKESKLRFVVMDGLDLENLHNYLLDKEFNGSIVEN